MSLRRLEGPNLPVESRGQILPWGFGDVLLDVPGIPLQVGYQATLANNCGIDDDDATLYLSGSDLEEIFAGLTPPYIVQIDNEWLRVDSQDVSPFSIHIDDRGAGGTTPAEHAKGATVYFIESRIIYAFLDAPPGLRYPSNAFIQLRLNGVAQSPPCTIRLQDDRIISGARIVTAEFDLSRYFGGVTVTQTPQTITLAEPNRLSRASGNAIANPYLLRQKSSTGLNKLRVVGSAPPAPAQPAGSSLSQPRTVTQTMVTRTVTLRTSPLGSVSLDIRGLVDTPAGRYTGTPNAPVIRPAHVARVISEATYGVEEFHEPSWTATAAAQISAGLSWRVLWYGSAFRTFREAAGFCGMADLWFDEEGRCRYTWQDRAAQPVATIEDLIGEMPLSFIPPSATRLAVDWGDRLQAGAFTLDSPAMQARYGVIEDRSLSLPFIGSESIARTVAAHWFAAWDHPRLTGTAGLPHRLAHLSLTDSVDVVTPLLALYGERRVPWQIRGIMDRLGHRVATLIEGDPLDDVPLIWQATVAESPNMVAW